MVKRAGFGEPPELGDEASAERCFFVVSVGRNVRVVRVNTLAPDGDLIYTHLATIGSNLLTLPITPWHDGQRFGRRYRISQSAVQSGCPYQLATLTTLR